jgi:hypothetical protein
MSKTLPAAADKALALFGTKEQMPEHLRTGTGLGNQNVSAEDRALPYINVLQALSPQVEELDGAKAGMFHNSITNELTDELYVMNLNFRRSFAIFKRRQLGGGYEGSYENREDAMAHIRDNLNNAVMDFDVVETHTHICLLLDVSGGTPKATQPVILNLSGTKVKVSKSWNSEIDVRNGNADRFASVWRLYTRKQSNTKGSWYNLAVEFAGWAPDFLYDEAKKYYQTVATRAAA